jgi:hypothetical protein
VITVNYTLQYNEFQWSAEEGRDDKKYPKGEGVKMPKFFVLWEMNPLETPKNPEERIKGWLALLQLVVTDQKAGLIKDWGMGAGGNRGYSIIEADSEAELFRRLLKWMPYVGFKAYPVLTAEQTIESIMKAVADMQPPK